MAKRKLTPEQRVTIRKEIRQYLAEKKKTSELQRLIAKKYGISTITARWYLKSVRDPQPPTGRQVAPLKGSGSRGSKKNRKAAAKRNGHAQGNGAFHRLVAGIQAIAEETFSRGREAKKLIPQWQAYVRKELTLKKLESRVRRELSVVSKKAQALHRTIRKLTSR